MMIQQQCPRCHNTTFHFDRQKHAIVCDICGTKQNQIASENEQLEYDKNRQKAIAFIRSGDYNSAKPFLDKMRQQMPDDSDIYYLHLMGLTDCCKDYYINNNNNAIALAQEYWNTFDRLGGDKTAFLRYMNLRKEKLYNDEEAKISQYTKIMVISIIIILISCILCLMNLYVFLAGIAVAIFAIFKKRCFQELWSAKKKQKIIREAESPFFKM